MNVIKLEEVAQLEVNLEEVAVVREQLEVLPGEVAVVRELAQLEVLPEEEEVHQEALKNECLKTNTY